MQDELLRLRLNGRASDSQFAQNPLPVARAMGRALGVLHASPVPEGVVGQTESEVSSARDALESGTIPPEPFSRVRSSSLLDFLASQPAESPLVWTHGAPIVRMAVLTDSVVTYDDVGAYGLDPSERDLSIAIRSIAETFTSEVSATFLEGYVEEGGALPHGPLLDWYGVVAAFRD